MRSGIGVKAVRSTPERQEVIAMYLEAFPEIGSDDDEGWLALESMLRVLGSLSGDEVGAIFGFSRQRADVIANASLKRMRLAGGAPLREAYEARATAPLVSCWDQLELHAPGEV